MVNFSNSEASNIACLICPLKDNSYNKDSRQLNVSGDSKNHSIIMIPTTIGMGDN